ncbi:MAG: outer membrane beta-barrel protein [bacterium]
MTRIRSKISIMILFSIIISIECFAQENDTTYNVNAVIGLGYSYYISSFINDDGFNPHSFNLTAKFMWQPEHLLRVGIESGYLSLYSLNKKNFESDYGTADVKISLAAIPIILVFSMELFEDFEVSSGVGVYLLLSDTDFYNNKVSSTVFSNGYYSALSYYFPMNDDISLGGELKYYYMSKIEDSNLTLQFLFKYNLLRY